MSFKNAKIVSVGGNSDTYHQDQPPRGDAKLPMSPSVIKAFGQSCPQRWVKGYESPKSDAMKFGNVVDCLVLTPEQFEARYAVAPETYLATVMECPTCKTQTDSKSCRKCKCDRVPVKVPRAWRSDAEFCAGWESEQAGKEIISADMHRGAIACRDSLLADPKLAELFSVSQKQVQVEGEWHDEETGIVVPVRCLIDLVPGKESVYAYSLGDLKTVQSAAQSAFEDAAYKYGYDIQAAFDLDLFNAATGEGRGQWCWPIVEAYPPFCTGRRFDEEGSTHQFITNGRARYRRLMALYCKCLKAGKWPGYDDTDEACHGWTPVGLKPWKGEEQLHAPNFVIEAEKPSEPEKTETSDDIML